MIRLFKLYIPNAVFLLALLDFVLLVAAGELGWMVRAHQIGIDGGVVGDRWVPLLIFASLVQTAMIAVGVYGSDALRSIRYATARLMVAISLGIIALSFVYFLLPGRTLWRSNLFYAMFIAMALLVFIRILLGGLLGTAVFRRRVLVLGAGDRAERLRQLGERPLGARQTGRQPRGSGRAANAKAARAWGSGRRARLAKNPQGGGGGVEPTRGGRAESGRVGDGGQGGGGGNDHGAHTGILGQDRRGRG
jgi:hypothetical protein